MPLFLGGGEGRDQTWNSALAMQVLMPLSHMLSPCLFLEARSHCILQAGLELMESSWLSFPSTGIAGMHYTMPSSHFFVTITDKLQHLQV